MAIYIDAGKLYLGGWNTPNDPGASAPWDTAAGSNDALFVSTDIAANQTYFVALVMDGDAGATLGTMTGYLNGGQFGQLAGVGQLFSHAGEFPLVRTRMAFGSMTAAVGSTVTVVVTNNIVGPGNTVTH